MYLFRGEFGCMLYAGDFRWETTSKRAEIGKSMLLSALGNDKVDILYLDNTYSNPSYSFPSREVAAQQVVDVIASHPEHDIIIGIDSLGKEDLLLHIAQALKIKIWVWPERLQIMHLLGFHDIFTTKVSLTRVRAVPRYSFSIDTLEGLNIMRPTRGIMPSGLPWKPLEGNTNVFRSSSHHGRSKLSTKVGSHTDMHKPNDNSRAVESYHEYIYTVPYSEHSCFAEIKEFIKLVQPTNLKDIIWVLSDNIHTSWVANRDIPISDKYSSELKILDGDLVLLNESQTSIWSTNQNSTTSNSVVAVLGDDGNLILRDRSNPTQPIWRSFDYLVHTWLPGNKISYNKRANTHQSLTSWKNSEDTSLGLFSHILDANNSYVLLWNGSKQYWTSGPWNGEIFSLLPTTRQNYV